MSADFGDPASLRSLSARLEGCAHDTDRLHRRISTGAAGLVGSVSKYEQRAAAAFHNRWSDVGGAISRMATNAGSVSQELLRLAAVLEQGARDFANAEDAAGAAGFIVQKSRWSVSVAPPPGAAHGQEARAAHLQQQMTHALDDADSGRGSLRRALGGCSSAGLADLGGHHAPATGAVTGDAGLDAQIQSVVGPMLAVHTNLSARF